MFAIPSSSTNFAFGENSQRLSREPGQWEFRLQFAFSDVSLCGVVTACNSVPRLQSAFLGSAVSYLGQALPTAGAFRNVHDVSIFQS
jgi:hypothetical protein